jgi:hypothetical protein
VVLGEAGSGKTALPEAAAALAEGRRKQHSSWSDRSGPYRFCAWPAQASGASPAWRPDPNRSTVRLLLYFAAVLAINTGLIFSNRAFDLWSYGDSNSGPLACHQQATRPPEHVAAGHRPAACTPVRLSPGRLRYFRAVPPRQSARVHGRCGTPRRALPEIGLQPEVISTRWILLFCVSERSFWRLSLCTIMLVTPPETAGGHCPSAS